MNKYIKIFISLVLLPSVIFAKGVSSNDVKVIQIDGFRTRELMPVLGKEITLLSSVSCKGNVNSKFTLEAKVNGGASISPTNQVIDLIGKKKSLPIEWCIKPGIKNSVKTNFILRDDKGEVVNKAEKEILLMEENPPQLSAKDWSPPITPKRTYYIDSKSGDDSNDGLSEDKAWKSFKNTASLILGPGERLLLKRGCVFNEALRLTAKGTLNNWAEIGAYGEGMRPQISRNRHINDRCCALPNSFCVVVRDIVFCNAGGGLSIFGHRPNTGNILVERCLFHHIEGMYRPNIHGIPEWRDQPGPGEGGGGLCVGGTRAKNMIVRDCEMYQCSSAVYLGGEDMFASRIFCHDNFSLNTSPHPYFAASRSWLTDSVFEASGYHAFYGTMGIMLCNNRGCVIRGCHFLNMPDSGSHDEGGIDFEARGENCRIEECTFRNNAGASIEVLGLNSPQTRNVHIRRCKFDRNNWAMRCGPSEVFVWGGPKAPLSVACSNGLIEDNGYVTYPGVSFFFNESPSTNDWKLVGNRAFDFTDELDRAFPYADPPTVEVCGEIWTDSRDVALFSKVEGASDITWEQREGPGKVSFANEKSSCTKAHFPSDGDYRVAIKVDNGKLWRAARTAVHILPSGSRTLKTWNFAKNLDMQGWVVENAGTTYECLADGKYVSHPVRMVCGDYMIVAIKDSADARILTTEEIGIGAQCGKKNVNTMRIKMQNSTPSKQMRVWWRMDRESSWDIKNSTLLNVTPLDPTASIYEIPFPASGRLMQLRIDFSTSNEKISGTCRIDYIWLGNK
jgi:hypothetical protein